MLQNFRERVAMLWEIGKDWWASRKEPSAQGDATATVLSNEAGPLGQLKAISDRHVEEHTKAHKANLDMAETIERMARRDGFRAANFQMWKQEEGPRLDRMDREVAKAAAHIPDLFEDKGRALDLLYKACRKHGEKHILLRIWEDPHKILSPLGLKPNYTQAYFDTMDGQDTLDALSDHLKTYNNRRHTRNQQVNRLAENLRAHDAAQDQLRTVAEIRSEHAERLKETGAHLKAATQVRSWLDTLPNSGKSLRDCFADADMQIAAKTAAMHTVRGAAYALSAI